MPALIPGQYGYEKYFNIKKSVQEKWASPIAPIRQANVQQQQQQQYNRNNIKAQRVAVRLSIRRRMLLTVAVLLLMLFFVCNVNKMFCFHQNRLHLN